MFGVNLVEHEVDVINARRLESAPMTCEINGFELLDAPLADRSIDFFSHQDVIDNYYGHCAALVSQCSGGHAYAFDHNIRSASGKESKKRIKGGQQVQGPAHLVHGDYTLYSAAQRLRDLTRPPSGNDTLSGMLASDESLISLRDAQRVLDGGRFAIINVWRNITDSPVSVHPLALCDSQTVNPGDLVVFEIHYADRIGENYFARFSDRHRWYYYPGMTRNEALLIKQWDSDGTLASSDGASSDHCEPDHPGTFSFHSAFKDSTTPKDAPDRWSIEVRCMVIYP